MQLRTNETDSRKIVQLVYLIAAGIVIFPAMFADGLFPGYGTYLMKAYMIIPCMLFLGSALTQRLTAPAKRCLLLSGVMTFWFVTVQANHYFTGLGNTCFGTFLVAYLLAFPYATVMEDGRKAVGLNWIGGFYGAYSLVMVVLAGMLLLDAVPAALAASVKWEGARASLVAHPNGGGCIMMLGTSFSLYFLTRAKNKWVKCLLAVLTLLQFCVLALTNSRTTILLTCAVFGGTAFFLIWDGGWKRFLAGAVVAAVVIALLFSLSGALFNFHSTALTNKVLEDENFESNESQILQIDEESGEATLMSQSSKQGTLSEDMWTLNNRTYIWKAAITVLQDNPPLKTWGTEYVAAEISYRNIFPVVNAHNSWIQILLLMGIPGCILAVVYTLVAVWNLWKVMWRKGEDLSRKVIAMIVITLLLAGILEAYLFTGDLLFTHFIFFLCTGYLIQWNAEASGKVPCQ